ncbi:sulfate adenylyltransferase [Nitrospina sp. 32_T5]|uniref:sulfate adenylyltransferase n=1 Tax=unclassified Nitrospina TaxID=2638683 RepID=UPI003F9B7431
MKVSQNISTEILQDLVNLQAGLYLPLTGFMTSLDYRNVVDNMMLSDHTIWTLPITLDVDHKTYKKALDADKVYLVYHKEEVGYIEVSDCFKIDTYSDVKKIFKTDETRHPGVQMEFNRSKYRVGGRIVITNESVMEGALHPEQIRKIFAERGWQTIVGFQTRNPIHKAHEHLQRVGLEMCDGLFINPLVGWKKSGDFSEQAVMQAYQLMIKNFYPESRVYLAGLYTYMRYAGPREAIFHALIRKNLGCTHFIIGRDQAGVGSYYGKYEAQDLARRLQSEGKLGIDLLLLKGPYFCQKCNQIVTEKHCGHGEKSIFPVSGTLIREALNKNERPDERFMRPEIADILISMGKNKFIGD